MNGVLRAPWTRLVVVRADERGAREGRTGSKGPVSRLYVIRLTRERGEEARFEACNVGLPIASGVYVGRRAVGGDREGHEGYDVVVALREQVDEVADERKVKQWLEAQRAGCRLEALEPDRQGRAGAEGEASASLHFAQHVEEWFAGGRTGDWQSVSYEAYEQLAVRIGRLHSMEEDGYAEVLWDDR